MTALDKNDPIWYPKSIPTPADTQGLAKAAQILNKAVQSQMFSQTVVNSGRDCGNQRGEKQRHFTTMTT